MNGSAAATVEWGDLSSIKDLPFAGELDLPFVKLEKTRRNLMPAVWSAKRVGRVNGMIDAASFVVAVEEGLFGVIDALLLGMNPAHGLIRRDLMSSLRKVEEGCRKADSRTLQGMVKNEMLDGVNWGNSGRESLLWLKRTMQFVCDAVYEFVDVENDRDIVRTVKDSYNRSLSAVHGFKAHAFRFFLNGIASRQAFLSRLGSNEAQVMEDLREWIRNFSPIVQDIVQYLNSMQLEDCQTLQKYR